MCYLVDQVIKYNINITVSLDGPKNINDMQRRYKKGLESVYDEVKKNIERLRQVGGNIYTIEVTYTQKHINLGITKEYLKQYFLSNFGVSEVFICNVMKLGEICVEEVIDTNSIEVFPDNKIDFITIKYLSSLLKQNHTARFCEAGVSLLSIFPNGDIFPCHSFALNNSFKLGNIKQIDWFNDSDYKNVINQIENTKSCYAKSKCDICLGRNVCKICTAKIMIDSDTDETIECEASIKVTETLLQKVVELRTSKENYFEKFFSTLLNNK